MKSSIATLALMMMIVSASPAVGGNSIEDFIYPPYFDLYEQPKSIVSLDPVIQAHIQERLREEGYDPGTIDGTFGRKSEMALKRFLAANDILDDDNTVNMALTIKLARSLLGVEMKPGENGDNLSEQEQLEFLNALGLIPSPTYWQDRNVILP